MSDNDLDTQTPPRFHFVRKIGRGVLGEVFEVIDEVRQEHVVLKVLLRSQPANLEEFRLEFQGLARLQHPNLVKFHHLVDPRSETSVGLQEQLGAHGLAFTQEFIDGHELLSYLHTPGTIEELTTLELRKVRTGEVPIEVISSETPREAPNSAAPPSAEVPSAEVPSAEVPSAEVPSAEVPSAEVPSAEVLGEEESGALNLPAVPATGEVPEISGVDEAAALIEEFTAGMAIQLNLDLVFLRLERIVPQIITALEHLHRYHKPHGSLRPSNILIAMDAEGTDRVKLTDYALVAGLVYCPEKGQTKVPFSLSPENLPFLAPESQRGQVSESSDLFALGCVLFEAIAGFSPHEKMEWTQDALRSPPLADCVPECPSSWASLVDGLLERNPRDRPSLARVAEVVTGREARPVVLPPTVVSEPKTFVGRRDVLEELQGLAVKVADTRTMQFVQLVGEVGSGKSTMVRALSHWLGRRGWLVVRARFPRRELGPFGGWSLVTEMLADLCDQLPSSVQEGLREHREALSHMLPNVCHTDIPGVGHGRFAAVAGLRAILAELSNQRPVLLCLDDLQWASWDSSALLLDLLSETNELRCLVLGTWQEGLATDEEHLLHTDLDLTLFSTTQVFLRGYGISEAQHYCKNSGAELDPEGIARKLGSHSINPLLLRELRRDNRDLSAALDALIPQVKSKFVVEDLLKAIYAGRISKLGKRERALLGMLAVSPIPLDHDVLCHAVELALSSSVVPQDGTESAIENSLETLTDLRLIREESRGFVLSQEPVRFAVMETFSERDEARFCGKIADILSRDKRATAAERFEFERRAGRSALALEQALQAAEEAELRYAYHRSAKIWRWILEHESEIPDYAMVRPTTELARVEHLAGRHSRAAELFHESADDTQPVRRILMKLEEAQAWMQAGAPTKAMAAIDEGLSVKGAGYSSTLWERLRGATMTWARGANLEGTANEDETTYAEAKLIYFALEWSEWLDPELTGALEWRLTRLARRDGSGRVVGMARLQNAVQEARTFRKADLDRSLDMVASARAEFERHEAFSWIAHTYSVEGWIHIHRNDFDAAFHAFQEAQDCVDGLEDATGFDHRLLLVWRGLAHLHVGDLEGAEHEARHLLHVHRGDAVARALASRLIAEISLLRGELNRAQRMIDLIEGVVEWPEESVQRVENVRLRTKLSMARGEPGVAVAQIDILKGSSAHKKWKRLPRYRVLLDLVHAQALAAVAARQKELGEPLFQKSLVALVRLTRGLSRSIQKIEPFYASEVTRLRARVELLRDRPKKSLQLITAPGREGGASVLITAYAKEVRGVVLQRMDKSEGKLELEEAWAVYRRGRFACPLVLEGWPIPRARMALKED